MKKLEGNEEKEQTERATSANAAQTLKTHSIEQGASLQPTPDRSLHLRHSLHCLLRACLLVPPLQLARGKQGKNAVRLREREGGRERGR